MRGENGELEKSKRVRVEVVDRFGSDEKLDSMARVENEVERADKVEVRESVIRWVCEAEIAQKEFDEGEKGDWEVKWDDVKGGELDGELVAKARAEEIGYMKRRGIWRVVPLKECWERTGKAPVGVRWVDTNKGSEGTPEIRSRLVARDFRCKADKDREDLFVATPPIEAERLALSRAATWIRRRDGTRGLRKLMFIDAKKAHLNPRCQEEVYIELPNEAGEGEGMCGRLEYWIYGCKRAAQAWEEYYAGKLEGAGFVRGIGCGVVFYHEERDVTVGCHGDDFTCVGEGRDLDWLAKEMAGWFEIKVRAVLGSGVNDDKEAVILGRIVRWRDEGIEFEADPRHRRLLADHFGFTDESAEGAVNGDRERREFEGEEEEEMGPRESIMFQGLAARLNYLAQDSPDLQYAAKEVARDMARPRVGAWRRLKRVVRYVLGRESVVWKFGWQEDGQGLTARSDSDWGGSREDRKSTSGGVLMLGTHCIKTWSSTQGAIALSSAEAEFYAMVDSVIKAKWVGTIAMEMGLGEVDKVLVLGTDSPAAKSFVSRRGLGRMRHIEVRDL